MKFVLVNGRTPRPQSFCALCCEPIGESYLRELGTRLSYCDQRCYSRPLQNGRPNAQEASEGIMTTTGAPNFVRKRASTSTGVDASQAIGLRRQNVSHEPASTKSAITAAGVSAW